MTGEEVKQRLWDLGHFRNPAMPTNVTEAGLSDVTLTSPEFKTALKSFQLFMGEDYDRLGNEMVGRPAVADGKLGPVTAALLEVERCGCPDYPEDVEAATGSGSWPAGCTSEYPRNHTFKIYWDRRRMPSFLNAVIEECIRLCYAAYRDIGIVFITVESASQANTVVTWEKGRGWIGLAIVGQNQTCSKRIWAKFDTVYRPSRMVDQWARLLAHEFGHNMGLRHSRGGVMNPSISSGPFTETAWQGDPSLPTLRRWFGGQPVPPKDGDDPDPPKPDPPKPDPPASDTSSRGSFEIFKDGESVGEFIVVPKIKV